MEKNPAVGSNKFRTQIVPNILKRTKHFQRMNENSINDSTKNKSKLFMFFLGGGRGGGVTVKTHLNRNKWVNNLLLPINNRLTCFENEIHIVILTIILKHVQIRIGSRLYI